MDYILKKNDIDEMQGIQKTHFLNDNAVRRNKSLGDATGLQNLGFHLIEVEPGCESTEYHAHLHEDECVYILQGSATVTIDEKEYAVSAGDFIGYPAGGLAHTMKNTGEQTLRCLVAGQRLAFDVANYPRQQKRIFRYDGKSDVAEHHSISNPKVGAKS